MLWREVKSFSRLEVRGFVRLNHGRKSEAVLAGRIGQVWARRPRKMARPGSSSSVCSPATNSTGSILSSGGGVRQPWLFEFVMKCLSQGCWGANEYELRKFNLADTVTLGASVFRVIRSLNK
jgi:hypothetical protein